MFSILTFYTYLNTYLENYMLFLTCLLTFARTAGIELWPVF